MNDHPQPFDLVIFDCDGVLVDSERIANTLFAKVLNERCGFSFTLEDMFDTFVGRSASQCMAIIEQLLGAKPPVDLKEQYEREINAELAHTVHSVVGIEQALQELDIACCVASSGSYDKMRTTLGKTGLLAQFDGKLFSTSDVARGKPFPDIYLHAAQKMGVTTPQRCLVVEDSPTGVAGGVAAGMVVFGYAELMRPEKLLAAGAHHVFDNMALLTDEIRTWSNER